MSSKTSEKIAEVLIEGGATLGFVVAAIVLAGGWAGVLALCAIIKFHTVRPR